MATVVRLKPRQLMHPSFFVGTDDSTPATRLPAPGLPRSFQAEATGPAPPNGFLFNEKPGARHPDAWEVRPCRLVVWF